MEMEGCVYEEDLFTNFSVQEILRHDMASMGPLFLVRVAAGGVGVGAGAGVVAAGVEVSE